MTEVDTHSLKIMVVLQCCFLTRWIWIWLGLSYYQPTHGKVYLLKSVLLPGRIYFFPQLLYGNLFMHKQNPTWTTVQLEKCLHLYQNWSPSALLLYTMNCLVKDRMQERSWASWWQWPIWWLHINSGDWSKTVKLSALGKIAEKLPHLAFHCLWSLCHGHCHSLDHGFSCTWPIKLQERQGNMRHDNERVLCSASVCVSNLFKGLRKAYVVVSLVMHSASCARVKVFFLCLFVCFLKFSTVHYNMAPNCSFWTEVDPGFQPAGHPGRNFLV